MRKRIMSAVLALCLLLPMLPTTALAADPVASGSCGNNVTWVLDSDGVLTISGTGMMADSASQTWVPWYSSQNSIQSVVIKDGVTSIGAYAFSSCKNMTSVTIPNSVTSIGNFAFAWCDRLTSVTIPDSVTSIKDQTFYCNHISSINVNPGNSHYSSQDGVLFTKDGKTLVAYPGGKSGAYMIPDGVTNIGDYAFDWCNGLTSVDIPASVTSIGKHAFAECKGLTTAVIPEGLTSIGDYAFKNCEKLASADIPSTVTSIGQEAFNSCDSLTSVDIPNGVTSIRERTFVLCRNLTSVTIPDSVTSIGQGAFTSCNSLTSVDIPNGVTSIGKEAFRDCPKLTNITIPASVTSIGESAFNGCADLTSATIPGGVTRIRQNTFNGCKKLNSVTIPDSVTSIEYGAFSSCTSLKDVYYGGSKNQWEWLVSKVDKSSSSNTCLYQNTTIHYAKCGVKVSISPTDGGTVDGGTLLENGVYIATCLPGGSVTVTAQASEGYKFTEWTENGTQVSTDASYSIDGIDEDRELVAVFAVDTPTPQAYTVTFDPNGGSVTPNSAMTDGDGKLSNLPTPSYKDSCHLFEGWYMDDDTKVNIDTKFLQDTTVIAKWNVSHSTTERLEGKEPTCTEKGLTDGSKCSVCNTVINKQEEIPALGHDWVGSETIIEEPTCVKAGSKSIEGAQCSRCEEKANEAITITIPANGHSYGEWSTTKAPTATQAGTKERVCASCGDKQTETIPATGGGTSDPDESKVYTITFDANGGTGGTTQTTGTDGRLKALPTVPTRTGYSFIGWFTAASGGVQVTTSTVFNGSATVYAHWRLQSASSDTLYPIYAPSQVVGGSVSVSHSSAAEGTSVIIRVYAQNWYELERLSAVSLSTGQELYLSRWYSGEYVFVMPAGPVMVNAAFNSWNNGSAGTNAWYVPAQPTVNTKSAKWYFKNGQIWHITDGLVPYNASFTRDMLVSILYNMDPDSFRDPMVWANTHSIVPDIYGNWLWGKDKAISREQTAAILFCFARHMGYNTSQRASLSDYTDNGQIRSAAWPAMSWSRAVGLMTGTSNTTLSPQSVVSCEQANVILSRFLSNVAGTW